MKQAAARWTGEGRRFEPESTLAVLAPDPGPGVATPMETLLAALAACTGMDVIAILGKKRQPVDEYRVEAVGQQREPQPHAFTEVVVEHQLVGRCDPEAVRRSVELSATRYCPVTAHLAQGETRIVHRYVLRDPDGEHRADVVVTGPHGAGLDPERDPAAR